MGDHPAVPEYVVKGSCITEAIFGQQDETRPTHFIDTF